MKKCVLVLGCMLIIFGCTNSTAKNKSLWVKNRIGSFTISIPNNYKFTYETHDAFVDSSTGIISNGYIKIGFVTGYLDTTLLQQTNKVFVIERDTIENNVYIITDVPTDNNKINIQMIGFDLNYIRHEPNGARVNGIEMTSSALSKEEGEIIFDIFRSVRPWTKQ